ncbi:hypothetical protein [Wolbachia endosymbiont of Nilaparvata lugens]|uniref:hypothetical protein n=1 Tax=Wolbachia endosymbiont of Nilaparvata lugens TaxID=357143 RepID=UPI00117C2CD9|nr:hypothetical protein [Wolbachia endosymbiont of Nilaparvata lugens]
MKLNELQNSLVEIIVIAPTIADEKEEEEMMKEALVIIDELKGYIHQPVEYSGSLMTFLGLIVRLDSVGCEEKKRLNNKMLVKLEAAVKNSQAKFKNNFYSKNAILFKSLIFIMLPLAVLSLFSIAICVAQSLYGSDNSTSLFMSIAGLVAYLTLGIITGRIHQKEKELLFREDSPRIRSLCTKALSSSRTCMFPVMYIGLTVSILAAPIFLLQCVIQPNRAYFTSFLFTFGLFTYVMALMSFSMAGIGITSSQLEDTSIEQEQLILRPAL